MAGRAGACGIPMVSLARHRRAVAHAQRRVPAAGERTHGDVVFLYFLARDDFKSLGWMLGPFDPNLGYPSDAAPYPSAAWRSSADQPTARRGSFWAALPGHQYAVHQAHVCQRRR